MLDMTTDYQKHTVSTDALDTLGTIIGAGEKRDAIHLAVEPVTAGQTLLPGNHVKFNKDGFAVVADPSQGIGIVDPFLTDVIDKGERFWLVVYPRQITTLRHVWEHPAFPSSDKLTKSLAETWLRNFAANSEVPGFEDMIAVTARAAREGDGWVTFGDEANGEIPAEYWDYLEVYLDEKFGDAAKPEYFSCAC